MATLTAFYDLAIGPVSFDFIPFLVRARMEQEARECARLHVVIVPDENGVGGQFRDKTALYDLAEMRWRMWNIVIPACQIAGATVTMAQDWQQALRLESQHCWPQDWERQKLVQRSYHWGEIVKASRAGVPVPRLQASAHARRKVRAYYDDCGGRVITMTLRTTYEPARNADHHWQIAADRIERTIGCRVVSLRDTDIALAGGQGYGELNLDVRMAMYQEAVQNLHCNGGPAQLCWYSDAPFIQFDTATTPEWVKFYSNQGLKVGEQLPWARPDQRLHYGPIESVDVPDMIQSLGAALAL